MAGPFVKLPRELSLVGLIDRLNKQFQVQFSQAGDPGTVDPSIGEIITAPLWFDPDNTFDIGLYVDGTGASDLRPASVYAGTKMRAPLFQADTQVTAPLGTFTRVTSPLLGTTTNTNVVIDRDSVPQVTLSSLLATFAGAATVGTDLTVNGNTVLGNATSDTITPTGRFNAHPSPVMATGTYTADFVAANGTALTATTDEGYGWTLLPESAGAITIQTNRAVNPASAFRSYGIWQLPVGGADLDLTLNCTASNNVNSFRADLIFRFTGNGLERYEVEYDGMGATFILFRYDAAGTGTNLGQTTLPAGLNTDPHTVRVTVVGSLITVYFDGVQQISVTDTTYTSGSIGIANSGSIANHSWIDTLTAILTEPQYDLGATTTPWRAAYINTLTAYRNATVGGTLGVTGAVTSGVSVTAPLGAFTTRVTSPLIGTTTAVDVVFDRNSVTQLTLGSLAATFAGTVQGTVLTGTTRVTSPLIGTTSNVNVVFDRNSVTQLTLASLAATFAGTVQGTVLTGTTRMTSPLHGTTTAVDVVFDRNSVTQLTLGSLLATFAGAVTVTTDLTVNGNTTLGNLATADTITPTARFAASLVPSTTNAIDLGTSALLYRRGYFTNVSMRGLDYVWPSADAAGVLQSDGLLGLSWGAVAPSSLSGFGADGGYLRSNGLAWVRVSGIAASDLTGTTLPASIVTSSLTTIGTLVAGAVPASLVTSGTFGAGAYTFPGDVNLGASLLNIGTVWSGLTLVGTTGLHIYDSTRGFNLSNNAFQYIRVAGVGQWALARVNGDTTTPTAVLAGQTIGDYAWQAYDGTTLATAGIIRAVAVETFGTGPTRRAVSIIMRPQPTLGGTVVGTWTFDSEGHLLAGDAVAGTGDNTFDFGMAGAQRARTGYFGTSLVVATDPTGSQALRVGGLTHLLSTTANQLRLAYSTSQYWDFDVSSVGGLALLPTGTTFNLALFAAGSYGSGKGVVFVANATTVPSTNPTGGGILYAEGGALKWRGSSGTVTTVAAA